jgi:hypothetical protein
MSDKHLVGLFSKLSINPSTKTSAAIKRVITKPSSSAAAAGRNSSVSVPLLRNSSTAAASLVGFPKKYTNKYYNQDIDERAAYRNPENWTPVKFGDDGQPKLYEYRSPLNKNITALVKTGYFMYITRHARLPHNGGSRSRRTVRRKHKSYRKSKRVRHTRRKQTRRHRHRR